MRLTNCNALTWNLKSRSHKTNTDYLILRLLQPRYKVENIANPWRFQACSNLVINKVVISYRIPDIFAGNLFSHYSRVIWSPRILFNNIIVGAISYWNFYYGCAVMSFYRYFKPIQKVLKWKTSHVYTL